MVELLGWKITIERLHSRSDCPICIAEKIRAACPDKIGERYLPSHKTSAPYGIDFREHCRLGTECRCLRQGEILEFEFKG